VRQLITLYNITPSPDFNALICIVGSISTKALYLLADMYIDEVSGIQVDIAFVEIRKVTCESLKESFSP